jgi:hypothetical protein
MPRIRDSTSGPYDFCAGCFPSEDEAIEEFGNVGDGPDGRGNCFTYDDMHPDYDNDYHCHVCEKPLSEEKDGLCSNATILS